MLNELWDVLKKMLGWIDGNKDYVVEQGTSGNWTYRKWKSGIAEGWYYNMVYSSGAINGIAIAMPSGVFTSVTTITANATGDNFVGQFYHVWGNTTTCYVSTNTAGNYGVSLNVKGKWK